MTQHADWFEFCSANRVFITDAFLRCVLGLLGRCQVPERKPKALSFDDNGWVVIPDGWEIHPLPNVQLRVLPRGHRHFTRDVHQLPVTGERLSQEVFETVLVQQVPLRLPTPFVGKVSFDILANRQRLWHRDFPARVGWHWPLRMDQ